jgi:hypothetical protein
MFMGSARVPADSLRGRVQGEPEDALPCVGTSSRMRNMEPGGQRQCSCDTGTGIRRLFAADTKAVEPLTEL